MLALALAALIHFRDVPPASWAFPDVTILSSAGVLHGERSGLFAPTRPVSRQQAAATLARTLALPAAALPFFHDLRAVSPSLRADVAAAVAAGILKGTAGGYLEPRLPLNRAAAAALLARAFKVVPAASRAAFRDAASIPGYAQGDVAALSHDGIVEGTVQGDFLPLADVTRAEWAAMLLRAIAFVHGAAGAPGIVAGPLAATYPPADTALAAESPLGGPSGAVGIGSRTLDLAAQGLVYRGAALADVYALQPGDLVVAFVGKDGSSPLILDLAAAAPNPLVGDVADLTPKTLYLDTGFALTIGSGATITLGSSSLPVDAWPAYLLWAHVSVSTTPSAQVDVASPYAFDLTGTIVTAGQQGFTVRLGSSSALAALLPALGAGDLVQVNLSQGTTITGVGADAPSAPAVGLSAQVQGLVQGDGSVDADHVTLTR